MDFDYKKHSLEKLETWVRDALVSAEVSPQEIYDTIKGVVNEEYHYFKHHTGRCYDLLALLNGNGKGHIQAYDDFVESKTKLECDKDDPSPECQKAWTSFWEENYYPDEYKGSTSSSVDLKKEVEEIRKEGGYEWTPEPSTKSSADKFKSQNGVTYAKYVKAKIEANSAWNDGWTQKYYQDIVNKYEGKEDKVNKWVLPVEETKIAETDETEYFVSFPDDLLEAANLKKGDQVEWVDQGDGSYLLRKV
jgi:hypothetical protein